MELEKFGLFLRELRTRRGLTQEQLAERLHVSAAAVSKWENGKCLPDLTKFEDLAAILDVSVLELLQGRAESEEPPLETRQAAQPVMALAELAFSDLDLTCQEAQARYGALSRYCFPRDYYPEVAREEHTLELWSAHFSGSYGQMWVYYSQAGYDETGAPRTGSSRIPALWYLEQTRDGAWEVVGIKEHP